MVLTWRLTNTLIALLLGILIFVDRIATQQNGNWRETENLAEAHPYVVALFNEHKYFICSGTLLNSRTVLTSGECVRAEPRFVAVAASVISHPPAAAAALNLLEVTYTVLHEDYSFHMNPNQPNSTKIISNIGLVMVDTHPLDKFVNPGDFGDYMEMDLEHETVTVVGFALTWTGKVILIELSYQQSPCDNPSWHYVFCGHEISDSEPFLEEFGKGGPVLYDSKVVGVVAAPYGVLFSAEGVRFNIFTIVAPYLKWIADNLYESPVPDWLQLQSRTDDKEYEDTSIGFSETRASTKFNIIILSSVMNLLNHF